MYVLPQEPTTGNTELITFFECRDSDDGGSEVGASATTHYQDEESVEGTPGQSSLLRLVQRQATPRLFLTGASQTEREIDTYRQKENMQTGRQTERETYRLGDREDRERDTNRQRDTDRETGTILAGIANSVRVLSFLQISSLSLSLSSLESSLQLSILFSSNLPIPSLNIQSLFYFLRLFFFHHCFLIRPSTPSLLPPSLCYR